MSDPANRHDLFQPAICPRCDYSLVGLAAGARCPECGHRRTQYEIVLDGVNFPGPGQESKGGFPWVAFIGPGVVVWMLVVRPVFVVPALRYLGELQRFADFVITSGVIVAIVLAALYLQFRKVIHGRPKPAGEGDSDQGAPPATGLSGSIEARVSRFERTRLHLDANGFSIVRLRRHVDQRWAFASVINVDQTGEEIRLSLYSHPHQVFVSVPGGPGEAHQLYHRIKGLGEVRTKKYFPRVSYGPAMKAGSGAAGAIEGEDRSEAVRPAGSERSLDSRAVPVSRGGGVGQASDLAGAGAALAGSGAGKESQIVPMIPSLTDRPGGERTPLAGSRGDDRK